MIITIYFGSSPWLIFGLGRTMKRSSENDHSSPADGENVDPNTASRTGENTLLWFLDFIFAPNFYLYFYLCNDYIM